MKNLFNPLTITLVFLVYAISNAQSNDITYLVCDTGIDNFSPIALEVSDDAYYALHKDGRTLVKLDLQGHKIAEYHHDNVDEKINSVRLADHNVYLNLANNHAIVKLSKSLVLEERKSTAFEWTDFQTDGINFIFYNSHINGHDKDILFITDSDFVKSKSLFKDAFTNMALMYYPTSRLVKWKDKVIFNYPGTAQFYTIGYDGLSALVADIGYGNEAHQITKSPSGQELNDHIVQIPVLQFVATDDAIVMSNRMIERRLYHYAYAFADQSLVKTFGAIQTSNLESFDFEGAQPSAAIGNGLYTMFSYKSYQHFVENVEDASLMDHIPTLTCDKEFLLQIR